MALDEFQGQSFVLEDLEDRRLQMKMIQQGRVSRFLSALYFYSILFCSHVSSESL